MSTSRMIVDAIIETPVELRGNLFRDIAIELNKKTNGYTASLFTKIAIEYGIINEEK